MADQRIYPTELQIGDWITSDLRRDYRVDTMATVDGDVLINEGTRDQVRIDCEQTVTIMPRHLASRRTANAQTAPAVDDGEPACAECGTLDDVRHNDARDRLECGDCTSDADTLADDQRHWRDYAYRL